MDKDTLTVLLLIGAMILVARIVSKVSEAKQNRLVKQKSVYIPPAPLGTAHELYGEDRLWLDSWVVLDVETTGLQAQTDRIIEIAMRKYEDDKVTDTFTSLVNPGMILPQKIVQLTGITDRDLRKAPKFPEITWRVANFIGGLPVVAHNARFDVEFLLNEWARAGLTRDITYIDTVKLAREVFPGMENYKLATLIERLNLLDHAQEHRALSDVDAAGKLYLMSSAKLETEYARREREREAAEVVRQEQARRKEQERQQEQARREEKAKQAAPGESRAVILANLGRQYETEGDIDKAIYYFSQAVAEGVELLHPYKRLAVLHRKRHEYADELRACTAAIQMLEWQEPYNAAAVAEFERRIAYDKEKLGAETVES